jgi:hypothetical protein
MTVVDDRGRAHVAHGVREGGQFVTQARTEPDVHLSPGGDPGPVDEPDVPLTRFLVPHWAVGEAEARIAAANRRLERAGIEQRFEATWSEPHLVERDGVRHLYQDLTLNHPKISYGGWEFVAALDQVETGTVIRVRPGADLLGWRPPDEPVCDHCHRRRHRHVTYVVRNGDGTTMQVGSSCLANFLGVKPAGLWALDDDPLGMGDDDSFGGWPGGNGSSAAPLREVIATALAVSDGGRQYVSKAAAAAGLTSTASAVSNALYSPARTVQERLDAERIAAAADRFDADGTVDEVLQTVRDMQTGSDYADNLRTLTAGQYVNARHVALVASAVTVWARAKEIEQVRRAEVASYVPGYVAPVGEKVPAGTVLTVSKVRYLDDPYSYYGGVNTLVLMRDEQGRIVKWFASGRHDLDAGQQVRIGGGRVKSHEQYEGKDQTVVTRLKYEVLPAAAPEPAAQGADARPA